MDWKDVNTTHCGVAACARIMGDHWSILILRDILSGVTRFQDLQVHTGISTAVLSKRLRGLVDAGLLKGVRYQEAGARARLEYVPTSKGRALAPVIIAMAQYGYDELVDPEDRLVDYRDRETGQPVRIGFVREDGTEISLRDVAIQVNPAAHQPDYAAPASRQQ